MIKNFEQFIKESYNSFGLIKSRINYYPINESQESKSQSDAIKLVMNKFGWDYQKADKFVREDLRNDITALRDKQIGKFTLGVTRMYCDGELNNASVISNLNATLKLLIAHMNEYDRNLNSLSADDLISKFETTRKNNISKEKQEINRMKFGVSDYEIVKIDSFNDAKKYYKYTNPNSRWCLTHMRDMYNSYTCDGMNQIYFCLKNGFENIKPTVSKNAPLDKYGLSMLSIIVNEEGELAYCTCRWNHDNDGNDSIMNAVEISKVVNVNFYETFKPNNKWKDIIDNVKRRLNNGDDPKEIFDKIGKFNNGFAKVKLNKKYNFINEDNKFLSDKWFEMANNFNNGFAKVCIDSKGWNYINKDGKYLSDDWFKYVENFENGFAKVAIKNKGWNYINKDFEFVSDEWFDDVSTSFDKNGFARVYIKNKGWNYINTKDKYLSDDWFEYVWTFENGFAKVKSNGKYNFINKNGELLSDDWFERVAYCGNDFAAVEIKNKGWNYINKDFEFISDKWFDEAMSFNKNGFARVYIKNKGWNFINTKGKYLSDDWFDYVWKFENGFARVELNGEFIFINTDGELLSDKPF